VGRRGCARAVPCSSVLHQDTVPNEERICMVVAGWWDGGGYVLQGNNIALIPENTESGANVDVEVEVGE
jgi:hypothetical protein